MCKQSGLYKCTEWEYNIYHTDSNGILIEEKNTRKCHLSGKSQLYWKAGQCHSECDLLAGSSGRCAQKFHNLPTISGMQTSSGSCFPCWNFKRTKEYNCLFQVLTTKSNNMATYLNVLSSWRNQVLGNLPFLSMYASSVLYCINNMSVGDE